MKRIMVTGVSAGAGKSTFARKLGRALGLPVYHLDAMYWTPGWIEASFDAFVTAQAEVVSRDAWIIEGNYAKTYDLRSASADMVIYLELPLSVCLYRVVKRWLTHLGKTRPDMAPGCKEKLDYTFIRFIVTTYRTRKVAMEDRLQRLQSARPEVSVVRLTSKADIDTYLESISSNGYR